MKYKILLLVSLYIKKKFILTNNEGLKMPFLGFKELKTDGHSHGNSYLSIFQGENLKEISNTMMFKISEKQINYHILAIEKTSKSFETSPKKPSFVLKNGTQFSFWYFLILILLGVSFIIYLKNRI